jgi:hypothetical protein
VTASDKQKNTAFRRLRCSVNSKELGLCYKVRVLHKLVAMLKITAVFPLQVMKDIFLLGRGELFLSFIDMADTLMKQSPTSTTQHGL